MNKLEVSVYQHHISSGTKCSQQLCPIALAIKEQYPEAHDIKIDGEYARIVWEEAFFTHYYYLPEKARDFVGDFDCGGLTVKPFFFTLDIDSTEEEEDDEDIDD